jgi:uncharacterized protein
MVSLQQIREFADRVAREFHPERIILFGSYADGTATEDSDVDLLVVMPFEGKNLTQSVEILVRTDPRFPADLLARRPRDTERRYSQGDPLIRAAIDHGKVLYERAG